MLFFVSAATSFNGFDKCPDKDGIDEEKIAINYLQRNEKKLSANFNAHIKDYQKYFNRVTFSLTDNRTGVATDKRLADYKVRRADHTLEELYFQFGRYLLISSSRPGGMPANLQGIWNEHYGRHGEAIIQPISTCR